MSVKSITQEITEKIEKRENVDDLIKELKKLNINTTQLEEYILYLDKSFKSEYHEMFFTTLMKSYFNEYEMDDLFEKIGLLLNDNLVNSCFDLSLNKTEEELAELIDDLIQIQEDETDKVIKSVKGKAKKLKITLAEFNRLLKP